MFNFITVDKLLVDLDYVSDYSGGYWFDYDDDIYTFCLGDDYE